MKAARYDRYFSMRLNDTTGKVFASIWDCEDKYDDKRIVWITQMAVKEEWRGQGIAKRLLRKVYETFGPGYTSMVGILTTNPVALKAVMSVFGSFGGNVTEEKFVRRVTKRALEVCPVEYVRDANDKLRWEKRFTTEHRVDVYLARVNTGLLVDLGESRERLRDLEDWPWRRELADGNGLAVILQVGRGI